jgi:hypothetical protein
MGSVQAKASSTQGTQSHPSPASGRDTSPGRIHASPEGLLRQWAHPRLAQSPARTGFVEKQPWLDRLTNRPYRRRIQCGDRLTSYPDTCASVGRVEVTAVTSPPLLTDLTGKQRRSPRSGRCANNPGKADNKSLSPPSSASGTIGSSASPDPGPRPQEESRPRPTPASASGEVSASPDLGLGPTAPQRIHHY